MARMTGCVKEIGHRQVYDILQSRKPRATRGELWGFGVLRWCEARVMVAGTRDGGRQDSLQGVYSALMLPGAGACDGSPHGR